MADKFSTITSWREPVTYVRFQEGVGHQPLRHLTEALLQHWQEDLTTVKDSRLIYASSTTSLATKGNKIIQSQV